MTAADLALGIAVTLTTGTVCALVYMLIKGDQS